MSFYDLRPPGNGHSHQARARRARRRLWGTTFWQVVLVPVLVVTALVSGLSGCIIWGELQEGVNFYGRSEPIGWSDPEVVVALVATGMTLVLVWTLGGLRARYLDARDELDELGAPIWMSPGLRTSLMVSSYTLLAGLTVSHWDVVWAFVVSTEHALLG